MSTVGAEIGIILIGNEFVTLVYIFLILVLIFLQRFVGSAPNIMYRFVAAFGISVVADFLLLAIVDIATDVMLGQ